MRILLVACALLLATGTAALAQDIKGSRDHPLVPRYEDSQIVRYATEDFTDYRLFTQPARHYGGAGKNLDATIPLEGKLTRISYRGPADRSALEVFRNYEQALKTAGFQTVFACAATNAAGATSITPFRRARATLHSASTKPSSAISPPASRAPKATSMSRSMW